MSLYEQGEFVKYLILKEIDFWVEDGAINVNDEDLMPYHDEIKFLFPSFQFLYELN